MTQIAAAAAIADMSAETTSSQTHALVEAGAVVYKLKKKII